MKVNTITFFGALLIGAAASAHDHRTLEQAELWILELQQRFDNCKKAAEGKDNTIVHKNKAIEAKDNYILFLENTLRHYKHELHKEKDHIRYLEILRALGI